MIYFESKCSLAGEPKDGTLPKEDPDKPSQVGPENHPDPRVLGIFTLFLFFYC